MLATLFTTPFHEAEAGRAGLIPGVVGLVTVETTVDNVFFFLILNQVLLCFVGSAAHPTLDVFTGGLMVTKAMAAVTQGNAGIRAPRSGGRKSSYSRTTKVEEDHVV